MCGCSHNETETRRRLETIRGTMGEDNVNKGELVETALKSSEMGIHPGVVNGERAEWSCGCEEILMCSVLVCG